MTVTRADTSADQDTPSGASTVRGRLMTPAHQLTSCGEFTRRSDVLLGWRPGLAGVQSLGAWLQLWVLHSRSDGTVYLTADEAAELLSVSIETWTRWADLLAAAGLLVPRGASYEVPLPRVLEGTGEHLRPGGWRAMHRDSLSALVDQLAAAGESGSTRAAALGVLAVVVFRHSALRGTAVRRDALPALYEHLDRGTVSRYLQLLAAVLSRPARGRLSYDGRGLLERPEGPISQVPSPRPVAERPSTGRTARRFPAEVDQEAISPLSNGFSAPEPVRFPPSGAPSRSGTSTGQVPNPGGAGATFVELVTELDRRLPGAVELVRHRKAKTLLRAALLEVSDVGALVDELCWQSYDGVRSVAGVIAARLPEAVDRIRLRRQLDDVHTRAERHAHAIHEQREARRRHLEQTQALEEAEQAAALEQAQAVTAAAGERWGDLCELVAEQAGAPVRRSFLAGRTAAVDALARTRVREVAAALAAANSAAATPTPGSCRGTVRPDAAALLGEAVQVILDGRDHQLLAGGAA